LPHYWKCLPLFAALLQMPQPAMAQSDADQAVFVFSGRFTNQYFEHAFNPLTVGYEDNYVAGLAYQRFFLGQDDGFKLGGELGAALRFGNQGSIELWAGPVLRADRFIKMDLFTLSASVTAGLSLTSDTIGIEEQREIDSNGDTTLLYFLAPEVSFATTAQPGVEYFWRIHHRSGGWETLGNLRDGANATTLGVRWSF